MLYAITRAAGPIPRWATYTAIGWFVVVALLGIILLPGIVIGYLPVGTYDTRILEQGNLTGYLLLWGGVMWIALCLLAAGLGATRMRSGSLLVGRGVWVWMVVVGVPCLLIGNSMVSNVRQDLTSGPVTIRGTVTAASSSDEQKTDSRGNSYTVTTYHLTIGGQTFSSSASNMADVFERAAAGRCAVVSYGPHTHELVDLTSCPAR